MKTGLTKKQKTTSIFFSENDDWIEVSTNNTKLRNRLSDYADAYPSCCYLTESDSDGRRTYLIQKGRFCFRLTKPTTEEQHAIAHRCGNEYGFGRKR